MRFYLLAVVALTLAAAAPAPAIFAQTSAPVGKLPGNAADAAKTAFLALPEADRKAVQDALVWLGFYNGVVDGTFGKRTQDAIAAFQKSIAAPTDGIVTQAQLSALKASAQKARVAVGFQIFDDPATGARIGAPLKWLEKKTPIPDGVKLASRDGSAVLELAAPKAPDDTLASLYARFSADSPARKLTYKAMKADAFFVVSGEEAGRKFYRRYAIAPAGSPQASALRGFVFVYPAAKSELYDPVAIAIANAFDPFPSAPKPSPLASAIPTPPPSPAPAPTPAAPALVATALVVAPGQAVTALTPADCAKPLIEGKEVTFLKNDASGLTLLNGAFPAPAAPARLGAATDEAVVLSLSPGGKGSLQAANASFDKGPPPMIVASLTVTARGAPAFDRAGGLIGFVAPLKSPPTRLGAVTIAEPHATIGAASAEALGVKFVPAAAAEPLGAADIARQMRVAVVGVFCAP